MTPSERISVVILYRHQLFGEGIAHLLAGEPDMVVTAVPLTDRDASAHSLAAGPEVVVFERGDPDTACEVLRAAPDSVVIDVALDPGPTFAWRREEIASRPDGIVAAIRRAPGPAAGDVAQGPTDADPVPAAGAALGLAGRA